MNKKYNDFDHKATRDFFIAIRYDFVARDAYVLRIKEYRDFAYRYLRTHNVQIIKRGVIRVTPKSRLTERVLTVINTVFQAPYPYHPVRVLVRSYSNKGDYQAERVAGIWSVLYQVPTYPHFTFP